MKEICLDEGTIQAFLDGELSDAQFDFATEHLASCDACAYILDEAEKESAFAFAALDGDLNALVPTQRLWSKINDSLVEEKRKDSFWFNFTSFLSNLSRPSIAAFASLAIVFGLFAALFVSSPIPNGDDVAVNQPTFGKTEIAKQETSSIPQNIPAPTFVETNPVVNSPSVPTIARANYRSNENDKIRPTRAAYIKTNQAEIIEDRRPKTKDQRYDSYLPGEETYLRTIANLSDSVNSQKDSVMKPSTRFAYEKDLAVIDDAIDKMKTEVKKNPKNEAAKDILFASYQNKINLLNSVQERTELMASIR